MSESADDDIAVLLLPLMSDEQLCDGLSEALLELMAGEVRLCFFVTVIWAPMRCVPRGEGDLGLEVFNFLCMVGVDESS